ncbi:hypothetical protein [Xenorhabdus bovienii]|nr:hypothetical protein [Xenorhabdus bovienii]
MFIRQNGRSGVKSASGRFGFSGENALAKPACNRLMALGKMTFSG